MIETQSPIELSKQLLNKDFKLPGNERHIPLILNPYQLNNDSFEIYQKKLPYLVRAFLKAYQTYLGDQGISGIDNLYSYPFIWRFDFLTSPESGNQESLKLLELNATRPGGIFLVKKAGDVYSEVFGIKNLLIPDIDLLGNFFYQLSRRVTDTSGRVGLAYTEGFVAEIEMPQLALILNDWAKNNGYNIEFISTERDHFDSKNGTIISPDGKPLTVFYENAGPKLNNGQVETFKFSGNYSTIIVNHPAIAQIDNKAVIAYLFDPRLKLSKEEQEVVEKFVPYTRLMRNAGEFNLFLTSVDPKDYFFKINGGLRASSGKGVYDGMQLLVNPELLQEIRQCLESDQLFIAQERIGPEYPWKEVQILDNGSVVRQPAFVDFNPYLFFNGEDIFINSVLIRAKNSHPINVSQGGGLGCVQVI